MRYTPLLTTLFLATLALAAEKRTPQDDLPSILAALRTNNPEDADAAATALKVKIRSTPETQQGDDVTTILDALRANNPGDADAAESGLQKRQDGGDDVTDILDALRANNPGDADAAESGLN
jgi:hypothetical protein